MFLSVLLIFSCLTKAWTTNELHIMIAPSAQVQAACNTCEYSGRQFGCVDETHFGFCFGGDAVDVDTIKECPTNTICNVDSPNFCSPAAELEPSCRVHTLNPDEFCAEKEAEGYYRLVGYDACNDYIYCYALAGQYLGWKFNCPGYFNDETKECQKEKPSYC